MARGNDPGKDFDNQYDHSRRMAEPKKKAGQGPWAQDKYLRDLNNSQPRHAKPSSDGCADKTAALFVLLCGFGWVVAEGFSRIL